ncbi:helix-turn-helix transcriptional regulator [Streptomyces coffeae]|uniref:AAA family ATPase n=1 Tax=Streptomyces coffeae TaxID=621382 RepID=A0ABS1NLL4_9ACTN|nr:LuxR family transcriptional regulator [Streptomyces coffeae]MBL1100888.1 AAA family ATPase [Streptomyces coffeae]
MRLVERDQELTVLTDMIVRSSRGEGQAALITGGIGCGKTALLAELATAAQEFGFQVLNAGGSLAERRTPGAVLGQLLRDIPHDPADRAALAALAGQSDHESLGAAGPVGSIVTRLGPSALDPEESHALQRLCTVVEEQARRIPLMLCVDDVQFMDELSLHGILLMLRRLPTAPLALIMTECSLSRTADPRLHAALRRLPGHRPFTLGRLSTEGVAALLTTQFGSGPARLLAPGCHAVSGGNPLLVEALAEDGRHTANSPAPRLDPGEAFLDAATGCLHRGWPALLHIAQALAVLHKDSPGPQTVARLAEVEDAVLARGLRALDNAGLLADGRPRHTAVCDGALAGCTGEELAVLHRRAAELLYEEGAPAVGVARHLVAADRADAPWAVAELREAAERHLAAGRPALARPCLDTALRHCRDQGERLRLKALLAGAAWMLDPSMGARHLVELADALRDGRLPAQHAVMLAKYLLWHGRYDEAADAIERMTRRNGGSADPLAAAEARATRELLSVTYPGLVPHSIAEAGPSRHTAFAGDPRSRGAAALSDVLRHGPTPEPVAAAEGAMRVMRLGRNTHEWLTCAVSTLLFADRTEAAAYWCDHWLSEAHSRRVPLWIAEFSSLRAGIALRQGRPLDARRLAKVALAQVPAESWGVCIGGPLANLIQANTDLGAREAAAELLEVPLPEGLFSSRFGLYYLHARGSHFLAAGQPQAALDDFTNCGALMRGWGLDQPSLIPWRSGAARAHLALASTGRAHELAREQLVLAGEAFTRTRGISLRALAAASRPSQRGTLLRSAVAVLDESGDQLQLAGALVELGTADLRSGRVSSSDTLFGRAARLAEACGFPLPACRPGAGSAGVSGSAVSVPSIGAPAAVRGETLELLSPAERRVVELASAGLTNKEISGQLNVTVSTVEQHLTRIFRKLGVRTRGDLPRAAGE